MAELVDALDLGSSVERRDGFESLYLHHTPNPQSSEFFIWLRSTEVVHFLGKEEVTGSNPVGASK